MKKETKKAPAIRFRGFTDDWEQYKLGNMGSTFTGLSGKTKEDFGHGNAQFVTYMNVYSNSIADLTMTENIEIDKHQVCVKYGDIFFTTSSETPNEVGMSSVWLGNTDNTYLNSFCFGYRPEIEINPYYMAYMLRSRSIRNQLVILAQGISRYNISKNQVMKIEVPFPALAEQKMIGECLTNIDNLITLHQRKLDQLKTLKKYFLQNMFPAKGEKVPRIRFKGFTGDWEQHKLDNLCLIIDTKHATAPITNEKTSYRMIRTDCVRNGRLLVENMDSVTKEIYDKWSERIHLKAGDIVFTREAPMGESAIIPDDGNSYFPGQRIVTIRSKGNVSTLFINYLIYANEFRREIRIRDSAATTVANFGIPSIKNYVAQLPCVKEQRKIGKYFNQLDNIITLHQRKLEQLQTMKKFMLQNLFI